MSSYCISLKLKGAGIPAKTGTRMDFSRNAGGWGSVALSSILGRLFYVALAGVTHTEAALGVDVLTSLVRVAGQTQ
jgi:hypothetical protein